MKEMVKKEIIQWLDAGKKRVSSVQCVPKKGSVNVVSNDNKGIKVDKEKIEVIEKLPTPTSVKGIKSFLGIL